MWTPIGQAATHLLHVVQLSASGRGGSLARLLSISRSGLSVDGQTISQTPHLIQFLLKAVTRVIAAQQRLIEPEAAGYGADGADIIESLYVWLRLDTLKHERVL